MNNEISIGLKTVDELKILRQAGKILANILRSLKSSLKPGIKTKEIEIFAESLMRKHSVKPAFKGYRGYPASLCVSLNDEIVHGIPSDRALENGDIVSIDCGIVFEDFYADAAFTAGVGKVDSKINELLRVTYEALYKGISKVRPNNYLSDISNAIQNCVEKRGFSVVREFVGHGIGKNLHEEPEIPNFGEPGQGPVLKEGMVLCIEPMVNMGNWQTKIMEDGWTVVTMDNKPSAHYEHMVAVTKKGPEILTR